MKKMYLVLLGILCMPPATFISAEEDDAILLEDEDIQSSNIAPLSHNQNEESQKLNKGSVVHKTKERKAFAKRRSKGGFSKKHARSQSNKIRVGNKSHSKNSVSHDSKKIRKSRRTHRGNKRSRGKR